MKWNPPELTYGDAADVADHLMSAPDVELTDIHSALVNALRRVATLERELAELKISLAQTANVASCLANGIKPD